MEETENKIETKETPEEELVDAIEDLDEKPIETENLEEKQTVEEVKEVTTGRAREFRGREEMEKERQKERLSSWVPKTKLGKDVKSGKIKNIDEILDKKIKILEPEIIDTLMEVNSDLISIGQSKGKFGGGKRRAWRQTQRKTKEGNVPTFSAFAVVGDGNGHVGIGLGKATETLPARDKAIRKAKINLIKIVRGDGSFDSIGGGNTSIPYKIEGKAGSVRITLLPAPPGTGLVVGDQLKKVLKLAGVKDVYGKTSGQIRTTFNLIKACIDALKKTNPEYKK
jgi:small subunit ribosomal protein S5